MTRRLPYRPWVLFAQWAVLFHSPLRSHSLQLSNPFELAKNTLRRSQLTQTVSTRLGEDTPMLFVPEGASPSGTQEALWSWVAEAAGHGDGIGINGVELDGIDGGGTSTRSDDVSVLAFPDATARDCAALVGALTVVSLVDTAGRELVFERLDDGKGGAGDDSGAMGAIVMRRAAAAAADATTTTTTASSSTTTTTSDLEATFPDVRERMETWVERVLVKLGMCPFTGSRAVSGVGLEGFGVVPAPIRYGEVGSTKTA